MRHLSGQLAVRALGGGALRTDLDAVLQRSTPAPAAAPARTARGPSRRASKRGWRTTRPASTARSRSRSGATTATRTSTGIQVTTPPGFLASLKGIPYCPEAAIAKLGSPGYTGAAEQASPACPAASQIGTAIAGAGAGTHPVYVNGKVYLAGPYKGAPLSLVVSVPALSGPYDLGVVPVRVAIDVDPETAQITAVSDPLPQIQEGIPLRTRFVRIALDRPGFALNPTNCNPFSVGATIAGDEGASASPSMRFQAANCTDLAFAPKAR